jgi:uncharacterized SAM-binding protein YcdF (DUF218 family)
VSRASMEHWAISVCRLVGCLGVAAFALVSYTGLSNWLSARTGTPASIRTSGAIVVLGSNQLPQGSLGDASLRRTIEAIALFRRGASGLILFLGSDRENGRTEADVRSDLALQLGIPPGSLLTNSTGLTTQGEALVSRQILEPRGIRDILLVTDSQHMTRAMRIFAAEGFDVAPASVDEYPNPADDDAGDHYTLMARIVSEFMARTYQALVHRQTP